MALEMLLSGRRAIDPSSHSHVVTVGVSVLKPSPNVQSAITVVGLTTLTRDNSANLSQITTVGTSLLKKDNSMNKAQVVTVGLNALTESEV